ncbi:hypothetical protein B0H34DRAFT_715305 [Crassisporium funariophilum]|nr:hypothetical protein B0H34DRAFT_715305 [Crassisporium funariophilum]
MKDGYHIFVGDTFDGRLADHHRIIEGRRVAPIRVGRKWEALGWTSDSLAEERNETSLRPATNRTAAFCHCKTISLRPTNQSKWLPRATLQLTRPASCAVTASANPPASPADR